MNAHASSVHPNGHLPATPGPTAVAIVGVSGRFPGGANSPALLWEVLKSGRDAVGEAQGDRWDLGWHNPDPKRVDRVYTRAGGFLDQVDRFDADFFGLSPREAQQIDPQQRLLLELAWEAHEDAGIAPRSRAGSDTGVFVGISSNDYSSLVGPGWPDAYSNTGSSFSIAANRISYILDLHGPSVAVDTACSSSLVCVHQAVQAIIAGECGSALAGGVNILTSIRPWLGFARASMLSPTGRCKSFDASGDGYVRAEGGGFVLLKRLADAERDGDRILGVILATGVNSDGRTLGLSMPNGDAQEALLRRVYAECGVRPDDVFYVEAHGTGTAVGDPIECGALGRVLGQPRSGGNPVRIGSVKSNIGHLESASGIAGLTKVLMALKHREIPANLHFGTPNPKIDFEGWKLEVVAKPVPLPDGPEPLVFGVNSFGFGGTNAHLVLQEYRPRTPAVPAPAAPGLLLLNGHSEGGLRELAADYAARLRAPGADWAGLCAATALCRSPLRHRLAVLAASAAEAAAKIEGWLAGAVTPGLAAGTAATPVAPIAFVYSGNGPQWWGMGRELLAENPVFRAEVEAVDAVFAPLAGWSLVAEMARPEAESRIGLTEVAQPMLFALQLGLTAVLRGQGVHPDAVLGHSVGEAAAAFASGALTRAQATEVIFHRSREQAKTAGLGKMAAIGVGLEAARAAMAGIDGWLELAASNGPEAVTVAGDPDALARLVDGMTAAGKFARVLPLNYPFHTRAMDPIRDGLVASLASLAPAPSAVPFISTVEGAELPGEALGADYWFRNVRDPVRFHEAVTHLLTESGIAVFIEIGPHPVLKDYVAQSARAAGSPAVALQTLRRPGQKGPEPESDNLATAIAAAHAHGASRVSEMFERPNPLPDLPLYPWQRVRHWRGGGILPDTFSPITRDHPLLGHRLPGADAQWENPINLRLLPYLADHVVQGSVLFPAAGYVEMALAAARLSLGDGVLDVESFDIQRPMVLPAQGDPLAQTTVDARDGVFSIASRPDRDATDFVTHVRGRLSRAEPLRDAACDPAAIAQRMVQRVTAAEHYADSTTRGLDYGPEFQGVQAVLLGAPDAAQREAMAEIRLGSADGAGFAGYRAHPSLLDSCVQVMIALIAQCDKRPVCTIPVQFDRVRSVAPLTGDMLCHVTLVRESARSAVADFTMMDRQGNLLMKIDGARCQKVDFNAAAASPLTSEWWRPDPAHAAAGLLPALPVPATPGQALAGSGTAPADPGLRPWLDRLAGAYAGAALAAIRPDVPVLTVAAIARNARVRREQTGLLTRLLARAEACGQITAVAGGWAWNDTHAAEEPARLWAALFRAHPRHHAELLLIAEAGESLVARLRGEDAGGPSAALLDQLLDTAPYRADANLMLRDAVSALVAGWPADRPLRILELGGGAGGLAAWVLPVLPAERADYLFADASESAVARAEHRLSAHRFARFAVLDPAADLAAQGLPAGYFDLVLAADLAGATRDPAATLEALHPVLAPGALLLVLAGGEDPVADLVLGRGAGLSPELLAAAGFGAARALGTAGETTLLAASAPATPRPVAALAALASRRIMLVAENAGAFSTAVAGALTAAGQAVAVRQFDATAATLKAEVAAALAADCPDAVVLLAAQGGRGDLLATQTGRCLTAVALVEALEASRQDTPCELSFVTRGAFSDINGKGPVDPAEAGLWGLGRVIGNEHSGLGLRLIDLHSATEGEAEAGWLAAELLRRDAETEVQLAAGHRFVNRERITTLTDEARHAGRPAAAYTLDFAAQGGLESLYLRELDRRAPGAGEVEIAVKAAGLNFRDVLWCMGMLPEEAVEHGFSGPTIGMECAGEVVAVGPGVTGLSVGDRVVAFASSCFASHVTTAAGSVARMPEGMDYAAAATIPTAFLTAWYALDHLARIEPGETVLIHGAAGGVGLAALQIAKLKGAKVIGTAGSPRKRRMLEMLGVDHVLNSRTLEFADEVMALTGGTGVDVVLNSLAGEAITKSLNCLRPFGRFLEIGKRDLYGNSRIGLRPFRNNLSYFGIDADTLLIERADLARRLFAQVVGQFASGALHPLPFQAIPVSRAAEAFRAMQQSRHVGKLVVSMELDRPESLPVVRSKSVVRPGVTYLVTGGLGGFGLASARWLAEQGATSLALLSRRGATTDEAQAGIAALETLGARVRPFAVDISDEAALGAVLEVIRAEMPPLAGVIHSAAVIEDAPILNIGAEQLERVFLPKLVGAWNLHKATLGDPIGMFVLYSSSSAVVGNPGQGAYVAANLSLDALAQHRRALGLPALAIGWGAIRDAGFLTRHEAVAGMLKTRTGLDATPAREALEDLARVSAAGSSRLSVARFDLARLGQMLPGARVPRFLPVIPKGAAAALAATETLADLLKSVPPAEHRGFILARVRENAARVLGTQASQVSTDQPLAELGLDSLMAVELAGGLERDLGQPVPVMQLLSAGSLAAIAAHVAKLLGVGAEDAAPAREAVAQDGRS